MINIAWTVFKGTQYPILFGFQMTCITYMKRTSWSIFYFHQKSTVLFPIPKTCFYESLFRNFMLKKARKSDPFTPKKVGMEFRKLFPTKLVYFCPLSALIFFCLRALLHPFGPKKGHFFSRLEVCRFEVILILWTLNRVAFF